MAWCVRDHAQQHSATEDVRSAPAEWLDVLWRMRRQLQVCRRRLQDLFAGCWGGLHLCWPAES